MHMGLWFFSNLWWKSLENEACVPTEKVRFFLKKVNMNLSVSIKTFLSWSAYAFTSEHFKQCFVLEDVSVKNYAVMLHNILY